MTEIPPDPSEPAAEDRFRGKTAGRQMALGTIWSVALRLSVRGIGLISTIILARILVPEDFGLVTMAMLLVSLVETLFQQSGERAAVIRHSGPDRGHYDTAWSLGVGKGAVMSALLLPLVPVVASYYGEPQVVPIMLVLALRPLILGFENIGVVDFLRDLDFGRDFRYFVYLKLSGFLVTIPLALILRDHWALVIGTMAGSFAQVALSYGMSRYRPRFGFAKLREMLSFSLWMFLGGAATAVIWRLDQLLLGRIGGAPAVGSYAVGTELAVYAVGELTQPASRPLFSVYAKLADRPAQLAGHYRNAYTAMLYAAAALGGGLALVADPVVRLVLGESWIDAIPIMQIMAATIALRTWALASETVLNAIGRARVPALSMCFDLLVFGLLCAAYWADLNAVLLAQLRLAATVLAVPWPLFAAMRALRIGAAPILSASWRPLVALAVMLAGLIGLQTALPLGSLGTLLTSVPLGAALFLGSGVLLWRMSGRPAGIEAEAMQALPAAIR